MLDIDERSALNVHENRDEWQPSAELLAIIFKRKTRDEWTKLFQETDACVSCDGIERGVSQSPATTWRAIGLSRSTASCSLGRRKIYASRPEGTMSAAYDMPEGETLLASFQFKAGEIAELKRNRVIRVQALRKV